MKTNLKMAVALAALTILAGAASTTMAQMVGGYKAVAVTDQYALAAANAAVDAQMEKTETAIELLSLIKAERQTVQGANYRLCMKITTEGEDENTVSYAQAVVYMDLKKNYRLTSWTANSPCARPPAAVNPASIIVGGYRAIAKTDAGAVAAAEFAANAQGEKTEMAYELGEIVRAEGQLVQGMNYRLCMEISADGEEPFRVQAVVYVDLKRNYRLMQWTETACK
jgi:hypothetical protein